MQTMSTSILDATASSLAATALPTSFVPSAAVAPKNSLTAHVDTLTNAVQQLSTENETLRRNMGILFRTARAELQRKENEIQRLQDELDAVAKERQQQRPLSD